MNKNLKNTKALMLASVVVSAMGLASNSAVAQAPAFNINGATVKVSPGALLRVSGNISNKVNSNFINEGEIELTGNFENNGSFFSQATGSTLKLLGTTEQDISGANGLNTYNLKIDNTAGTLLNNFIAVTNQVDFTKGIFTTVGINGLYFRNNASAINVSDASHVNGNVAKLGTGSFIYPTGDGTRYQKVGTNISSGLGAIARYYPSDAGNAPFTVNGSEPVLLSSYNNQEYWDIKPFGSAPTGNVTVFYDGYKDNFTNPNIQRRVAHMVNGEWVNEGPLTGGSGTTANGSVTSNSINTFSPFALGFVGSVLPIKWLSLTGNLNASNAATLTWQVQESNASNYILQKSSDGISFRTVGTVASKGNGTNTYTQTDGEGALVGKAAYRVLMTEKDGQKIYSDIVQLSGSSLNKLQVYPTVFSSSFTVINPKAGVGYITDAAGRIVQKLQLKEGNNTVTPTVLAKGMYILRIEGAESVKFIKE